MALTVMFRVFIRKKAYQMIHVLKSDMLQSNFLNIRAPLI